MKTYSQWVQFIKNELAGHYPDGEITGFIGIIFRELENISPAKLHMKYDQIADEEVSGRIEKTVEKLKIHVPVQHIFGKTEFYGLPMMVTPDVLIPRPETEELVDWVIKENKDKNDLRILDIGTGSGCIAITLEKNLNCKRVVGLDISKQAIGVAKKNVKLNNGKIGLKRGDILQLADKRKKHRYDIIVSNPPYVTHSEKEKMHANVLDHEPHEALFVDGSDPLKFYDAICEYAKRPSGREVSLYFEINEKYGTEVFNLMIGHKFDKVVLKKDLNGKERMVKGVFGRVF